MVPVAIRAVFPSSSVVAAVAAPAGLVAPVAHLEVARERVDPVVVAVLAAVAVVVAEVPRERSVRVARAARLASPSARSVKNLKCRRRRP